MSSTSNKDSTRKKVLIVGGGAAGMSAAYALSKAPEKFEVTLYERSSAVGGMATSTDIDEAKYGASYINDGVQGASPVFHNTYAMFDILGFKASPVGMQVSFGRDAESEFWSNVFPSRVIDRFRSDISKFGKVLKIIKVLEPVFAMISVQAMLRMFGFSKDFGQVVVFPLVALFFGTGNQTPFVSSAILERVFMDPSMRLFEYSSNSFLASIPEMRAFPRLSELYFTWKNVAQETGNVRIVTQRLVTRVKRSNGKNGKVLVWTRSTQGTDNNQEAIGVGDQLFEEEFDELILAVDADSALHILGDDASWMEAKVLGNVKYLFDVTVTHNDFEYMDKYYRLRFDPSLQSSDSSEDARNEYSFAEENFKPLYYVRSYPTDKLKVEMSFDLTHYQPQFKGISPDGNGHNDEKELPPLSSHVFQTIFLDKDACEDMWSKSEISEDKVMLEKQWKQQSHRWQHYARTVPWMMFINGKMHTYFAGAWTILNMHEIAVVSGFAAAYRIGADYPFLDNEDCKRLFKLYLVASHGVRLRATDRTGIFG